LNSNNDSPLCKDNLTTEANYLVAAETINGFNTLGYSERTAGKLYNENRILIYLLGIKISQILLYVMKDMYMPYGNPKYLRNWWSSYCGTEGKILVDSDGRS
jgi:hypothetical protein